MFTLISCISSVDVNNAIFCSVAAMFQNIDAQSCMLLMLTLLSQAERKAEKKKADKLNKQMVRTAGGRK